jgi:uncharacterized membrane protein YgdD (TMEM256/DUF423 family)
MKNSLKYFAIFGFIAVALGAFGAHALQTRLSEKYYEIFQTAVTYQFYHVFALGIVGVLQRITPARCLDKAALFFVAGIILFSGSLYVLAITQISWLGMITPIGGLSFLMGWIAVFKAGFTCQVK